MDISMGYDASLLEALLQAMEQAHDELSAIKSSDPAAIGEMIKVRSIAKRLNEHWLPLLHRVLGCEAMTLYTSPPPDTTLFDQFLKLPKHSGCASSQSNGFLTGSGAAGAAGSWFTWPTSAHPWRSTIDPLAASDSAMTVDAAAFLGAWVTDHDGQYTEADLAFLQAQLARVETSSEFVTAFLAAISSSAFVDLVNELGTTQAEIRLGDLANGYGEQHPENHASIDHAVQHIATIIVTGQHEGVFTMTTAELSERLDPYPAALLVQQMHLDADELGALSVAIIRREPVESSYAMSFERSVSAAAVLMATILATVDGPSRYVVALVAADLPGQLITDPINRELSDRILFEGTRPDVLSAGEQSIVIPMLVDSMTQFIAWNPRPNPDPDRDVPSLLAMVMAPYLLQIFGPGSGTTRPGFDIDVDGRSLILNLIDQNPAMANYLAAERDQFALSFDEHLGHDFESDRQLFGDLALLLGILDGIYERAELASGDRARAQLALFWSVAAMAGLPLPTVGKLGARVGATGAQALMEGAGVGPASPHEARQKVTGDTDARSAVMASVIVNATFDAFVAQGRIPAASPRPPEPDTGADRVGLDYVGALSAWISEIEVDAETAAWLLVATTTFLSPHEAAKDSISSYDDDD